MRCLAVKRMQQYRCIAKTMNGKAHKRCRQKRVRTVPLQYSHYTTFLRQYQVFHKMFIFGRRDAASLLFCVRFSRLPSCLFHFFVFESRRSAPAQVSFRKVDFQDLLHAPPKGGFEEEEPLRHVLMYRRFAHAKMRRARAHRATRLCDILPAPHGALAHILPTSTCTPLSVLTHCMSKESAL